MDPRVTRTREALAAAILELIQLKRWEKITVQDLLDATGISRSTFYAHYDNKLTVLTSSIPEVSGTIRIDSNANHVDLTPLFTHVDEIAPVLRPILSQAVFYEITDEFERQFALEFAQLVDASNPFLPRFLAGALISTIREYATERNRARPEDAAAEVAGYINALLDSALLDSA